MEIHKPRPIRGWRDFSSEMCVIVLGIAIALSGELLIETLHWRRQVAQTELSLTNELEANIAAATARLRTAQCVERRLDEIATVIDHAAKSGTLPPMGAIGRPIVYLWGHGAWDSALASQITTHFADQRLRNFAVAFQFIERLGDTNQRELEAWTDLEMVTGPGRPFDEQAAEAARSAARRARLLSREMTMMGQGLMSRVEALNLRPQSTARAAALEAQARQPLSAYLICQPIGKEIGLNYTQAPLL